MYRIYFLHMIKGGEAPMLSEIEEVSHSYLKNQVVFIETEVLFVLKRESYLKSPNCQEKQFMNF